MLSGPRIAGEIGKASYFAEICGLRVSRGGTVRKVTFVGVRISVDKAATSLKTLG